MLAFFDESGHPHPNDSATRPTCVVVCINEKESHYISGRLHALKRDILQKEDVEFKAWRLLNRGTFRRIPEKRELVETFFDLLRNLPVVIFAITMERPQPSMFPLMSNYLPNQFRYLLQRCDLLAQETNDTVTMLFDGDCRFGGLSLKFNSFLYRSDEGQSMRTIADAPFFVDSRITAGIQIADMAASVVRIYEENGLAFRVPTGDTFLSAIKRYYTVLKEKTKDLQTPQGEKRPGFYLMPERAHYGGTISKEPASEAIIGDTEEQKPENQA
ncbi:MAG: DUF3800 domain-containing protein [Chloroflexota bacterium]